MKRERNKLILWSKNYVLKVFKRRKLKYKIRFGRKNNLIYFDSFFFQNLITKFAMDELYAFSPPRCI